MEASSIGPSTGYSLILARNHGGPDSTSLSGLSDDRNYWVRVKALDLAGRQLLQSAPIMTSPGPQTLPEVSIPIELSGRFSWSPSGDTIAFVDVSVIGQRTLTLVDLASFGATHVAVFSGDGWFTDAIWSPDGSSIAFTHTPTLMAGGIDYRIWTVSSDGSELLSRSPGRVDFDPAWGGGEWLYFCRGTFDPPNIPEVWRTKPGIPSSTERLTSDPSVYKYEPTVRSTDDEIVYSGRPKNAPFDHTLLYAVNPQSRAPRILTPSDWYGDTRPFWDPDGRHVTFISTRCGHREVWSLDSSTGALKQITRSARGANKLCARWSPDARRLAVVDGREAGGSAALGQLEFYDAAGLVR